jgi:ABC-type Zn uptake system ZnuABC Zn-binding protein ZnuA
VKIIMVEPYFDLKTPNSIASSTGAKVLVMPPSVGGVKGTEDYFKLFDYDVAQFVEAMKKAGSSGTR